MRPLVSLLLIYRYVLSCASTSLVSSPVTTSTENPITTTATESTTSTSTTTTTTTSTTTTTTTTTLGCPDGWSLFETNCFMFVNTPVDGITAGTNCMVLGGNLASIHSKAENDFVNGLTLGGITWIGIVHLDRNINTFMWSDGTDFGPYTNWRPSEPALMPGEMCGVLNVAPGLWDDAICVAPNVFPYVCEQPATGG